MTEIPKPKVADAPGLVWRPRTGGWAATWQARTDLVQAGFEPGMARLWAGTEPTEIEKAHIATQCQRLQADMLLWSKDRSAPLYTFDGTIRTLVNCYQTDTASRYHKKRFRTRQNHDSLLKRIVAKHGDVYLADIKARTLMTWYEEWSDHGRMLATWQAIRGQFRVLFSFGFALLEDDQCDRLCRLMSSKAMQFESPKSRDEAITAEQAIAVRKVAREQFEWDSIALGQALQFELILRQKDVIGEWVPISEPGLSDVTWKNQKWIRGLLWQEIDDNLILTHMTSKRQKSLEVDLKLAPMVMEEFGLMLGVPPSQVTRDILPALGPVVENTITMFPYSDAEYRRKWRKVANAAGVPKYVFNMDSRSGGITEAAESGAPVDHIRRAATHSNLPTTEGYIRGNVDAQAAANVMRIRVGSRNKPKTE